MADEAAEAPKGGKSKLLIILIVVSLLVIGGGAAAYFLVLPKLTAQAPEEEKAAGAEKAPAEMTSLGATYELEPFIVNLTGDVNRYLKVVVVLQLSDDKVAEEIANRTPQIKDSVITLLSSKTAEEILTVQGKYDLKVEMVKRINSLLTTGVVRKLYFVEFVIQ